MNRRTFAAGLLGCGSLAGQTRLEWKNRGPKIVLVSGDEEYRSEEMMPQLAAILGQKHRFDCTVLFAIDRGDGTVNPNQNDNIPGLEALKTADLMVLFTRWRDLPDDQMKHVVEYVESGKPIVGIRTATHAFELKKNPTYAKYSSTSKEWDGGFGRQVLGETWVSHHGKHGKQSTKALFAAEQKSHPILKGIKDGEIWGPTDVYTVRLTPEQKKTVLLYGSVLTGMNPEDGPVEGSQNEPMLPVAWTGEYKGGRVFTTTMGSADDFSNQGFRRLLVNSVYWALGREKGIRADSDVSLIGSYTPTPFGFNKFRKGLRPKDFAPGTAAVLR